MKTRGKVVQRYDGEWFDTERFHKFFCCDCGLVHLARFRVRKGKIEMMVIVDKRATAARRQREQKCILSERIANSQSCELRNPGMELTGV